MTPLLYCLLTLPLAAAAEVDDPHAPAAWRQFFAGHWQPHPREEDVRQELAFNLRQQRQNDPPGEAELQALVESELPAAMAARWLQSALAHHCFIPSGNLLRLSRTNPEQTEPGIVQEHEYHVERTAGRSYLVLRRGERESWYRLKLPDEEAEVVPADAPAPFNPAALREDGVERAFFERSTVYRKLDANSFQIVVLDWRGSGRVIQARSYRRVETVPAWAATAVEQVAGAGPPVGEPEAAPEGVRVVTNSLGMQLALIPAGEFTMGSPEYVPDEVDVHIRPHRVRISRPFYLGRYEVTQAEWQAVMENNPSHFSAEGEGGEEVRNIDTRRFPVENINWFEALAFCNALSERENLPPYYKLENERPVEFEAFGRTIRFTRYDVRIAGGTGYRLPTEAEWEYACRAGTETPFSFGEVLNGREANVHGNYPFGTQLKGPVRERPLPVGSFAPNAFGLYDMHGNVVEFCLDQYDRGAYNARGELAVDPVFAPEVMGEGSYSIRGGGFQFGALAALSHYRQGVGAGSRNRGTGFRVARDP